MMLEQHFHSPVAISSRGLLSRNNGVRIPTSPSLDFKRTLDLRHRHVPSSHAASDDRATRVQPFCVFACCLHFVPYCVVPLYLTFNGESLNCLKMNLTDLTVSSVTAFFRPTASMHSCRARTKLEDEEGVVSAWFPYDHRTSPSEHVVSMSAQISTKTTN